MPSQIMSIFILILHFINCCDASQPLLLTSLIESGNISEAQKAANVKPFLKGVRSYAGYLTVDKALKSHLFFWFFPKVSNWSSAPLAFWLQGGLGASSMFAVFYENGPYIFKNDKLKYNRYSWTKYFNVLYVDNPVGTGFSFTESDDGYATNQTVVGKNLYETLRQFLLLFPELQNNKIILSGQSLAGKYLSAMAAAIIAEAKETMPPMKVFGLFVSSPLISPEDMLGKYNEYFYSHGLLDVKGKEIMKKREEEMAVLIRSKKWIEAGEVFTHTFLGQYVKEVTFFYQLTGIPNYYHLQKDDFRGFKYRKFLNMESTKEALHAGQNDFGRNERTVYNRLRSDIMKSMKTVFAEVVENYRVLIFSGQMDIICPYYANENMIRNLAWNGSSDYYAAKRYSLNWDKHVVGYYKEARNLVEVLMRNCGHLVGFDKPQWTLGLLKKFADGQFYQSNGSINIRY